MIFADFCKDFLGVECLKELPYVVVRNRYLKLEFDNLKDLTFGNAYCVSKLVLLLICHRLKELA
jgi:hypothetical protein